MGNTPSGIRGRLAVASAALVFAVVLETALTLLQVTGEHRVQALLLNKLIVNILTIVQVRTYSKY